MRDDVYVFGMEPLGIGIDLIELERVRGVYQRHGNRFLHRVYTAPERQRASQMADPTSFLAGRFAAKEAVLKVLGTGLTGGISWQDVSIHREPSGAPRVYLANKALLRARKLGLGKILITITHSRDLAMAQAMGYAGDAAALQEA